jgi:hypothetical protein
LHSHRVQARANFRRLLLRDSPSSQPPKLQKFNFGTASPTRRNNYSVLQKSDFCSTYVHWILSIFKISFKLVDILSSGRETSWSPSQPGDGLARARGPLQGRGGTTRARARAGSRAAMPAPNQAPGWPSGPAAARPGPPRCRVRRRVSALWTASRPAGPKGQAGKRKRLFSGFHHNEHVSKDRDRIRGRMRGSLLSRC